MTEATEKKVKASTYWAYTTIYIAIVVIGSLLLGYFGSEGREHMEPDEWGTVLAGVFSPLAFLWLIFASLSQREELGLQREQLRLQRDELVLTRAELKRNSDAQFEQKNEMAAQVAALTAHTKLLEAQATATYEPVFVVYRVQGMLASDSFITIFIDNGGCDVLDVLTGEDQKATHIWMTPGTGGGRTIRGRTISHWPKGGRVQLTIPLGPADSRDDVRLSFSFTRLDTSKRKVEFVLRDSGYLLHQLQSSTYGTTMHSVSVSVPSPP